MSLADPYKMRSRFRIIAGLALLAAPLLLAGCTVAPLYSNARAPGSTAAAIANIHVVEVSTRQAQEVRNQLIFMLSGGKGNPANAPYRLELVVSSYSSAAAVIQAGTTEQSPTASVLNMSGRYTITDSASGALIARGQRQVASAYDVPRQEFAALRAIRDAENRAAHELAEQLRLAVAQEFASKG